jgi:hypothetical protein
VRHCLPRPITGLLSRRRIASLKAQDQPDFGLQFTRPNHEIETGEMGFNGQFALQKFPAAHVGSGSFSTEPSALGSPVDVGSSPKSSREIKGSPSVAMCQLET